MNRVVLDGQHHFGWYLNSVPFDDQARTITLEYWARFRGTDFGDEFDNNVDLQWNVVDRFGNATPQLAAWPTFDELLEDTTTITYNRPILSVTKESDRPTKWDFDPADNIITYVVTVTNSGSIDAHNVAFWDNTNAKLDIDITSLTVQNGTCDDCAIGNGLDLRDGDRQPGRTPDHVRFHGDERERAERSGPKCDRCPACVAVPIGHRHRRPGVDVDFRALAGAGPCP